jgi:hypothetical protein
MVFALALLVIGAALGGGLGGGLSAAHKTAHVPADSGSSSITPDQQQTTSHPASPAATTTGPSTISLSASTSAPSSTIQPFSTSPGTYRIINVYTNTAVDLLNGGTTNDTEIECW